MASRLSRDNYFLLMARLASLRGTCARRTVGCILVSSDYQVLATGYNGVPAGVLHCIDAPCDGANDPSGDTTRCRAIHAEVNAVEQAERSSVLWRVGRAYTTTLPCLDCAKLLVRSCARIRFIDTILDYPGDSKAYFQTVGLTVTLHPHLQHVSLDALMQEKERWR